MEQTELLWLILSIVTLFDKIDLIVISIGLILLVSYWGRYID